MKHIFGPRPGQDGSAAYSAIVTVSIIMVTLGVMIYVSRGAAMGGDLSSALADAVRAGSLESTPARADAVAQHRFRNALQEAGIQCDNVPRVEWDAGALPGPTRMVGTGNYRQRVLRPGATISATARCVIRQRDLVGGTGGPALADARSTADRTVIVRAAERIDPYRGGIRR